jgi:hypothetical protein
LKIEDRLTMAARNIPEHVIYLGELVEKHLKGEFGEVLKALLVGRISMELSKKSTAISSDRTLGRLEMANDLWQDLEQYVLDKDGLLTEIPKEEESGDPIPQQV